MIDNLPVTTLNYKNLTVEGYSRAAVQSYWRVPELKLGFDMGGSPWSFMGTQIFCLTHGHLDHLAALPVYIARRRMMKMEPPTIYLPEEILDKVQKLLKVWQTLDRGRMVCNLVGVKPGDEIELSREHVISVFRTEHTVPSVGYLVWDRRKKLKPKYQGLSGDQIRDIRLSGEDVTEEIRFPLFCYTGDTTMRALDEFPAVYESMILLMELTFFLPEHRTEKIHKFGHIHLEDIIDRADRLKNELIICSHFSARYHDSQILKVLDRKLPEKLKKRLHLWM